MFRSAETFRIWFSRHLVDMYTIYLMLINIQLILPRNKINLKIHGFNRIPTNWTNPWSLWWAGKFCAMPLKVFPSTVDCQISSQYSVPSISLPQFWTQKSLSLCSDNFPASGWCWRPPWPPFSPPPGSPLTPTGCESEKAEENGVENHWFAKRSDKSQATPQQHIRKSWRYSKFLS